MAEGKVCTKCGEWKPLTEFWKRNDASKQTHVSHCRACITAKRNEDPERQKEYKHDWYDRNRDRILADCKAAYEADPEPKKERARKQRESKTPEELREYNRDWRRRRPEVARANSQKGRDVRRARLLNATSGPIDYSYVCERDAWTCYICGHEVTVKTGREPESLSFDHVVPLAKGGSNTEDNIRVTHRVCNLRKATKILSPQMDIFVRPPHAQHEDPQATFAGSRSTSSPRE